MKRITIAVPTPLINDANQMALCLGDNPSDVNTFPKAQYKGKNGRLFSVCSLLSSDSFIKVPTWVLVAPEHSPETDVEAATRAQATLVVWDTLEPLEDGTAAPNPMPSAVAGVITAIAHDDVHLALKAMGLTRKE